MKTEGLIGVKPPFALETYLCTAATPRASRGRRSRFSARGLQFPQPQSVNPGSHRDRFQNTGRQKITDL